MRADCKGCKERTLEPNCHLTCKKYLKFKEDYEKQKKEEKLSKGNYVTYNHWAYIRKDGKRGH